MDADASIEVEPDDGGAAFDGGVKMGDAQAGMSSQVLVMIESYGWFLLLGVVLLLYFKSKFNTQTRRSTNQGLVYDADAALERQAAMERARQKFQERHDAKAALYREQQKKKEEEKRQAKIEDWERHQEGKGYRSKYRPTEESPSTSTSPPKPAKKKTLRDPNYSPLMGDGASCSWRPGRPSGGAGGG